VIGFRHADPRFPFLWDSAEQPPARWHGPGEGPVQYLADTPDGAWAEFLRHEEITELADLATVRRALWAVALPRPPRRPPALPPALLFGGPASYPACQQAARARRARGVRGLRAPSAALAPGQAGGWRVAGGLQPAAARDGVVWVLFGPRPALTGWLAAERASPPAYLLARVRHFA
jgi:hypothetical protein